MILETIGMDKTKETQTAESVYKDVFKKFQSVTKAPEAFLR